MSSSSGAAPLSGSGGKHLAIVEGYQDKEKVITFEYKI
jgi:hypothetical protein